MKLLKLPRYPAGFRRPSRSSVIMQGTRATIIVGINGLTGREIKILSGDNLFFLFRCAYRLCFEKRFGEDFRKWDQFEASLRKKMKIGKWEGKVELNSFLRERDEILIVSFFLREYGINKQ